MPDRSYYREHRERLLAEGRSWKEANRDRARTHNRESARRAAERRKKLAQRRERGRAWYAEHRDQERERARRFRREHPDKLREYNARYKQRHPELVAEKNRRAGEQWRDRNAEAVRAKGRAAAAARREKDPDEYRRRYQADLEAQRARGREASRRRTRLKQLGLPPRKVQRVYANERRANDRASDQFFHRKRTTAEKLRLLQEREAIDSEAPTERIAVLRARTRIMTKAELRDAAMQLQAQLRTDRAREMARRRAPDMRALIRSHLPEAAARIAHRHGHRMREEIRLDSIARELRGGPPYDIEAELRRRAAKEVFPIVVELARQSRTDEEMKHLVDATFPRIRDTKTSTSALRQSSHGARRAEPEPAESWLRMVSGGSGAGLVR